MNGPRIRDVYPTHRAFAFRMLTCLTTVAGTLSEAEFNDWFSFPRAKRVLRRFKREAFRVYVQTRLRKSLLHRLRKGPFLARIRIIRVVRQGLCKAWKAPSAYALYREVVTKGFDQAAFNHWWNELLPTERLELVYNWARQIKQSVKDLWLDRLGSGAQIFVLISEGDSGGVKIF